MFMLLFYVHNFFFVCVPRKSQRFLTTPSLLFLYFLFLLTEYYSVSEIKAGHFDFLSPKCLQNLFNIFKQTRAVEWLLTSDPFDDA